MPTILLRHITKRYLPQDNQDSFFLFGSRTLAKGIGAAFDIETTNYIEEQRAEHEPPERSNALDDLSLTIHDGETLSILGPSGSGKTTLLKVIAGLIEPDSGDVLYDGQDIDDIPPEERGIGMVFQNYALYPHLKTHDNIGFFDLIRKQPERIPERIHHIVDVMGIDVRHLLSRKPPTLSGGERQRVAVGRCLARDPKLFLFDEPISNLDAKMRVETRSQIKRLLIHYAITSVYVTHDQTESIALADRIVILRGGQIEQAGSYQTLYNTPINAFVAQFFGTPPMNLLLGQARNNAWHSRNFSVGPIRPGLKPGQRVWLGIRPEHIELAGSSGIPAKVDFTEPDFAHRRQMVYTLVDGQRCAAQVPLRASIQPNMTIHLHFPPEHIYLFDHETEQRIG
jgi:multiple sugar transport system ATP-binding protein